MQRYGVGFSQVRGLTREKRSGAQKVLKPYRRYASTPSIVDRAGCCGGKGRTSPRCIVRSYQVHKQRHYTTLHTTLHHTTLHHTTLHYTTLHYTTLHYTTLHYTTLHHTTPHYTTLHYTTLHYTTRTQNHALADWGLLLLEPNNYCCTYWYPISFLILLFARYLHVN